MKASRQTILSQLEVSEMVKTYVRLKYHERIEKGYELSETYQNPDGSITFTFKELLDPFVKSGKHGEKS